MSLPAPVTGLDDPDPDRPSPPTSASSAAALPSPSPSSSPPDRVTSGSGSRRAPRPPRGRAVRRLAAFGGLAGLVVAVVVIVTSSLHHPGAPALVPSARPGVAHPRYWIVRPGQSFAGIAQREGTTAGELERLNPRLSPGSLLSGQRVRLPG